MKRESLLAALARYAPSDAREAESLAHIRRFLAAPHDPFQRDNPEGHVTGSAVVARPDGAAFLLILHRKLGRWLQPGGHTEESDASVLGTALREAREETGLSAFEVPREDAILDVDVHPIPARSRDAAHLHFDVRYLLVTRETHDRSAAEDPARPMRWTSFEDAFATGADDSLLRALGKARAQLEGRLKTRSGRQTMEVEG
jgi:8-oxo-dGTP pyrophosphatase MutT (NUDIX family)